MYDTFLKGEHTHYPTDFIGKIFVFRNRLITFDKNNKLLFIIIIDSAQRV